MPRPTWQSSEDNIQRTNNIIKTLASWYSSQTDTVVGIAPLNEYVSCCFHASRSNARRRPAGYFGDDVMNAVRQYWYDRYVVS